MKCYFCKRTPEGLYDQMEWREFHSPLAGEDRFHVCSDCDEDPTRDLDWILDVTEAVEV